MKLQVLSQLVDSPGQNGYLDLWRTCVLVGGFVIRDDLLLFVLCYHRLTTLPFSACGSPYAAHIVIFSFNKADIITENKDFATVFLQIIEIKDKIVLHILFMVIQVHTELFVSVFSLPEVLFVIIYRQNVSNLKGEYL